MDRKLWDELHQVYVAIPDEFILVPPDGGDVRSYEAVAKMADEIERLRGMLIFALDGLDDYWITLPEGVELVNQIKALKQKESE